MMILRAALLLVIACTCVYNTVAQDVSEILLEANKFYDDAESIEMDITHEIYVKGFDKPERTIKSSFVRQGTSYKLSSDQGSTIVDTVFNIGIDAINRIIMVGRSTSTQIQGPQNLKSMVESLQLYKRHHSIKAPKGQLGFRFVPKLKALVGHDSTDIFLNVQGNYIERVVVYLSSAQESSDYNGQLKGPPERMEMKYRIIGRNRNIPYSEFSYKQVFQDTLNFSLTEAFRNYRLVNTLNPENQ